MPKIDFLWIAERPNCERIGSNPIVPSGPVADTGRSSFKQKTAQRRVARQRGFIIFDPYVTDQCETTTVVPTETRR
jgi:hypothetical protein